VRHTSSRRRSESFPSGQAFTAPAQAPRKDTRETIELSPSGEQMVVTCPVCQGEVTLKKANPAEGETSCEEGNPYPGVKKGDMIVRKHRPGGGRFSPARDVVICDGYGMPVGL